jgi:hypothetical protein
MSCSSIAYWIFAALLAFLINTLAQISGRAGLNEVIQESGLGLLVCIGVFDDVAAE